MALHAASREEALFCDWLSTRTRVVEAGAQGLYYAYYDTQRQQPWLISTPVSAQVARFHLRIGRDVEARATGQALLAWQHRGAGEVGGRLVGALPSEIARTDTGFAARSLYDVDDNLAVLQALLELHGCTGERQYLDGARAIGTWVRDVMSHGEQFGVWLEPYGAPMKAATSEGGFDNRIAVGRTLFWLPALEELARATDDPSFARLATHTADFLAPAQTTTGGFADHYDPGWPAEPYDATRFEAYQDDGAVVAEESLLAALGAVERGDEGCATRVLDWLPQRAGRVPGYLQLATGEACFPGGHVPYDDLLASALYRELSARLGASDGGAADFLLELQSPDGGWFWGWRQAEDAPITLDQATLTGLWALHDCSPRH